MFWLWFFFFASMLGALTPFIFLLILFGIWAFVLGLTGLFFLLVGTFFLNKALEQGYFRNHW